MSETTTDKTRRVVLKPPCPSVWHGQHCALPRHLGTEHWNGFRKVEESVRWSDADVIAELQEKLQNLLETNNLYLT